MFMQAIIKTTILFTLLYLLTGCSNDFLNENLTRVTFPIGESNIYISPDWESNNYMFKLPSLKDADYEIVTTPSWLNVSSVNGHLSDSVAIIQCSAIKNSDFGVVGIYMDFITVKANDITYKVPVAYINEGNPTAQVQSSVTLSYDYYGYPYLQIKNNGLGILLWNIVSMPDWLTVDTSRLESSGFYISQYNSYNIPLRIIPGETSSGNLTGNIIISTNDKQHPNITVNATTDLGTPQLSIYTSSISFASTEISKALTFSNYGTGKLVWKFEDIPEWLTITPSSGMYSPYTSYGDIVFNCDRTKLAAGQNTAVVNLKTNDSTKPTYSITVTAVAPGKKENIRAIEGNITDAVFNKNTNTLYYVTSAPNKFVAYDVNAKAALYEILLSKAPTCFAISEDWTKVSVGHNGTLSAIDLSTLAVSASYELDYSVNDIAWCENDLFCYTQKGGSSSCLHWIYTATGTKYDDTKTSLDGSSVVKKVPNQPYLIATRNSTSPSGFFAYDIASKSVKSYSHMDLTNFWMSEDGLYIFCQNSNVYRTTSSTGSSNTFNTNINAIGKFSNNNGYSYGIKFISHINHSLWVVLNDSYSSDASTSVCQFEDNDYTFVKKYTYDLLYQPDAQTTPFSVNANYVFVNNEGTALSVLCKGVTNSTWIIQSIPTK